MDSKSGVTRSELQRVPAPPRSIYASGVGQFVLQDVRVERVCIILHFILGCSVIATHFPPPAGLLEKKAEPGGQASPTI